MTPCTGILGRLFGHNYRPGYPVSKYKNIAPKPITYYGHVCTRCGHVVNKEQK